MTWLFEQAVECADMLNLASPSEQDTIEHFLETAYQRGAAETAWPDLLKAIQELSQISDGIYVKMSDGEFALMREAWTKVTAAIAKATGAA